MISFQETDPVKKDTYLDQAQKLLDQAIAIAPNESELYMLQGFLYPSRINIDPISRGVLYMDKINASLNKALELNPDNPRVYYLRATMTFHMPEAFGGGGRLKLYHYTKLLMKNTGVLNHKLIFHPIGERKPMKLNLKKLWKC